MTPTEIAKLKVNTIPRDGNEEDQIFFEIMNSLLRRVETKYPGCTGTNMHGNYGFFIWPLNGTMHKNHEHAWMQVITAFVVRGIDNSNQSNQIWLGYRYEFDFAIPNLEDAVMEKIDSWVTEIRANPDFSYLNMEG